MRTRQKDHPRSMMRMRDLKRLLLLPLATILTTTVHALSAASSSSEISQQRRHKLAAAFASPSGSKLTLSPELVIPEPRDATSILLLSNAVQTLSERIRLCKTNAAFVQGSVTALQTFTNEQATALGNFPGPVPVVYCCSPPPYPYGSSWRTAGGGGDDAKDAESVDFAEIASAGADGVMIPVVGEGGELRSMAELLVVPSRSESVPYISWVELCHAALAAGLQPIPEITIGQEMAASWNDAHVESLVAAVIDAMGMEPVSIVLTINPVDNDDDEQDEPVTVVTIPTIPKAAAKRVPILGSVRVMAGDNRLSEETLRFKEAGFSGTVLRSDCVPGFRLQPNLEVVGKFWQACITDLKSTRSKSFSFRSKNKMNVSAATKWGNYQQSVIESGALGDPSESASLNEAAGDYQGFA